MKFNRARTLNKNKNEKKIDQNSTAIKAHVVIKNINKTSSSPVKVKMDLPKITGHKRKSVEKKIKPKIK